MIKTRLTELVGIKYPIIQAGMGPFPVTSLCIAASNAGCLGLCSTFGTTSRKSNPVVFEDFCKQAHAELSDDDVTIFKKCSCVFITRPTKARFSGRTSWYPPR